MSLGLGEGMRGGIKRAVGNETTDVSVLWTCDMVMLEFKPGFQ